jgi:hypothetical protein
VPAERESHGHGIRAGWEPDRCQRSRKAMQTRLFSIRSPGDLRSSWPDGSLAGISSYDRRCAAIPVRDLRRIKTSRQSFAPNSATEHPICRNFTGATGLEPAASGMTGRSWRLRAERGSAGIPQDEQGFPTPALRGLAGTGGSFRRPPAGCARDASVAATANGGMRGGSCFLGVVQDDGRHPADCLLDCAWGEFRVAS